MMTKTWQDYVQVSQTPTSNSNSDPVRGQSDEEEMKRIAQWYNDTVGAGETLVDISADLKELGIDRD